MKLLLVSLCEGRSTFDGGGFLALLLLTAFYAYPVTFAIGIPSYLVYRRFQIHTLRSYVVGGFVAGLLLGMYLFGTIDSSPHMPPLVASVFIWLTIAIAAAIETTLFWVLVIRCDPNTGVGPVRGIDPAILDHE